MEGSYNKLNLGASCGVPEQVANLPGGETFIYKPGWMREEIILAALSVVLLYYY